MDSFTIEALVPFNMIIDTDVGLLKLVEYEYHSNFFYSNLLGNFDYLKYMLANRNKRNPLSVIAKEDTSDEELDDLYNQFINERYESILKLSSNSPLMKMIKLCEKDPCIHYTVVFQNELEEKVFYERGYKPFSSFIGDFTDKKILNNYNSLFVKYIDDLDQKDIKEKGIYIANLKFNKELKEEIYLPKLNIYDQIPINDFYFIDIYDIDEKRLPQG